MNTIQKKKHDRFIFLKTIYEESNGEEGYIFNMWEIGKYLNFTREETSSIFDYLEGEGLLKSMTLGGGFSITHLGIVEVEEALSEPDQPTEHFLPFSQYNTIHIENMNGGAIQQATNNSTINNIVAFDTITNIENYIEKLTDFVNKDITDKDIQSELLADIETIKQQTKSPKPKKTILKVSLQSVKEILIGASGGIIGTLATPKAQEIIQLTEKMISTLSN
ncbi:hypothetical protein [Bergeyella sp. RCAD1439]|uniref:hypothetical protein n=1 Tax=Bergeyella anatis TaxID=3113737 RepID=UPI002E19C0C4|nr:hypothetical protein [Bergeyella sp. RCAD1439]